MSLLFVLGYPDKHRQTVTRSLVRPGSKKSIFQTSFLGVLSVAIHSNEVAKGQIARNIIKIGLIGP